MNDHYVNFVELCFCTSSRLVPSRIDRVRVCAAGLCLQLRSKYADQNLENVSMIKDAGLFIKYNIKYHI